MLHINKSVEVVLNMFVPFLFTYYKYKNNYNKVQIKVIF